MKCPNALKTQSKWNFFGGQKNKSWKAGKLFQEKGKLQQQNIPNDLTFWHDQDEIKISNQK